VLEEAHKHRPADREVLYALVNFNRENGNLPAAVGYAEELVAISPDDPEIVRILHELREAANH
jgi:hypothetical protein